MKTIRSFLAFCFLAILVWPAYCQDIQKADQLGEEFQKQMPYSKPRIESGETPGQVQPKDYIAPPQREKTEPTTRPQGYDYPLCFNPYTRAYDNCYPEDSEHWRLRYSSPDFRFWWEHGRTCPPGYYFRQGRGCYRY